MGWNCTVALVHGAGLADLSRLGWTPTTDAVTWDEATSSAYDGLAALARPDGLVLATGGLDLVEAVDRLATLGPTYARLMHSVTDTSLREVADASVRRRWHWST